MTRMRKPSASKQRARAAARTALVAELKAVADTFELDDDNAAAFLSLLTRYSENNAVLILAQAAALGLEVRSVADVGGYKAFREAGRQVRAGEHRCLYVWARGKSRREEDSSEDELPVTVVEGQTLPAPRSFFPVGIFHISQTDPVVDWVDELMADGPRVEPNPHCHCSMQDSRPCPTGEHTNPYPGGVSA